jgi:hypothetical protein
MANKRVDPAKTQKKLVEGQAPASIRKASATYLDDINSGVSDHYVDDVRSVRTNLHYNPTFHEDRMKTASDLQDYSKPLSSYLKAEMDKHWDDKVRNYEPIFRDYWRTKVTEPIMEDQQNAADVLNAHGKDRMKPGAEPISAMEKYYRANPDRRPVVEGEPAKNPFGGSEKKIIERAGQAEPAVAPFGGGKKKEAAKPTAKPTRTGFQEMQRELLNGLLEEQKRTNRARSR